MVLSNSLPRYVHTKYLICKNAKGSLGNEIPAVTHTGDTDQVSSHCFLQLAASALPGEQKLLDGTQSVKDLGEKIQADGIYPKAQTLTR